MKNLSVYIFAYHKFVFNEELFDYFDKSDDVDSLIIIAPIWRVREKGCEIKLRGYGEKKISGLSRREEGNRHHGCDGKPGLPGLQGKFFFGLGNSFQNLEKLKIDVSGGDGQDGQDGQDGGSGRYQKYFSTSDMEADDGGNGGNGGSHGDYGFYGDIIIKNSQMQTISDKITSIKNYGKKGKGGMGGNGGSGGRLSCTLKYHYGSSGSSGKSDYNKANQIYAVNKPHPFLCDEEQLRAKFSFKEIAEQCVKNSNQVYNIDIVSKYCRKVFG